MSQLDLYGITAILAGVCFAYTCHETLEYQKRTDVFLYHFQIKMKMHKMVDFNYDDSDFNFKFFYIAVTIGNIAMLILSFISWSGGIALMIQTVMNVFWFIGYFLTWRRKRYIESLRVPWET